MHAVRLSVYLAWMQVPPALCELLPNLAALLERGRDVPQTFPLVEAYMLLGAGQRCAYITLTPRTGHTLEASQTRKSVSFKSRFCSTRFHTQDDSHAGPHTAGNDQVCARGGDGGSRIVTHACTAANSRMRGRKCRRRCPLDKMISLASKYSLFVHVCVPLCVPAGCYRQCHAE